MGSGLLTEAQLEEALRVQSDEMPGERLRSVLIQLGHVTSEDMAKTVAQQLDISYLSPDFSDCDPEMAELLSRDAAERLNAVPLRRQDKGILVAMVNPDDMMAMDDVSVRTGGEVVYPAVVSPMTLEFLMNRVYRNGKVEANGEQDIEVDKRPDGVVISLEEDAEDSRAVQLVNRLLQQAIEERASDLHVQPEADVARVRYRIDGMLQDIMTFERDELASVVSRFKILARMDISERRIPQDGRIRVALNTGSVDLRISSFPTIHGEKVVVRILDQRKAISEIGELGMEEKERKRFREMLKRPWGMILVSGPTGSGKTTTLTAGLHEINDDDVNIMTLEDPVEYRISGVNQSQTLPQAGFTFASGLRSLVRQDPDIIMIGEIRDGETAEMAVRAALTGHLLLSTVHTNSAAGTVGRIVDMGIEPYLVGSTLLGVVGQRLLRRLCPTCAETYDLPEDDVERLTLPLPDGPLQIKRPVGCSYCNGTGYRGRVGIYEVMEVNRKIIRLVTERASTAEIHEQAIQDGMIPLVQDGVSKVLQGITSLSEVRRIAYDLSEAEVSRPVAPREVDSHAEAAPDVLEEEAAVAESTAEEVAAAEETAEEIAVAEDTAAEVAVAESTTQEVAVANSAEEDAAAEDTVEEAAAEENEFGAETPAADSRESGVAEHEERQAPAQPIARPTPAPEDELAARRAGHGEVAGQRIAASAGPGAAARPRGVVGRPRIRRAVRPTGQPVSVPSNTGNGNGNRHQGFARPRVQHVNNGRNGTAERPAETPSENTVMPRRLPVGAHSGHKGRSRGRS